MKRFVLTVTAVAATTFAGSANAQLWLRDPNSQGKGFHAGGVEIHPSIGAEVGYTSNYFNRPKDDARYPVIDVVSLRMTPSIQFKQERTPALPTFTWTAGAGLIYSEFLNHTADIGRNREIGLVGNLGLNFLPGRTFGFSLYDTVARTTQPALDVEPTAGLNRVDNVVGGDLIYTRKGGLLDWRWGYAYGLTRFEADFAKPFDNDVHTVTTKGRFRFLPRTALIYNGSLAFTRYRAETPGLADSESLRSTIGLNGLLSDRLSVLAAIGWGTAIYNNRGTGTRDFDSVIGQFEAKYFLTSGEQADAGGHISSVSIGFIRSFQNSYLGNYYESDRGYLGVSALFGERMFVSGQAGIAALRYADVLGRDTGRVIASSFTDGRIDASLFAEYRVASWFGLNASFVYVNELSNQKILLDSTGPSGPSTPSSFGVGFARYTIFAGVRAFY